MKSVSLARVGWVFSMIASGFVVAPLASAQTVQRGPDIAQVEERPIAERMGDLIGPINLDDVPAKRAFEWWSKSANVPLVMNWDKLAREGIDPDARIKLNLNSVPAKKVLKLLVQQMSETSMVIETTEWYVRVMTKGEANLSPVTRVYDIGDLMHDVQPVGNAPRFDLGSALSNTNSGGGGSGTSGQSSGGSSGNSQSIFEKTDSKENRTMRTETERSDEIAKMITETIEPEIWASAGGTATIKYFRGRLIVHAPIYVHEQIGMPESSRPVTVNPNYRASSTAEGSTLNDGARTKNSPAGRQTGKPMRVSAKENE